MRRNPFRRARAMDLMKEFLAWLAVPTLLTLTTKPWESLGAKYGLLLLPLLFVVFLLAYWLRLLLGEGPGEGGAGRATLTDAVNELAESVERSWGDEVGSRQLGLTGREIIKFVWRPAEEGVASRAAQEDVAEAELAGVEDLVEEFLKISSRRLVIMGPPGIGKTSLALLLTVGLVRKRRAEGTGFVPVKLSVAGWDPEREDLLSWMEGQLVQQFSFLKSAKYERDMPRRLLETKHVLPVLDGLDEMRVNGVDTQRQAFEEINRVIDSLCGIVVTCRDVEYRRGVHSAGLIRAASVVRLQRLRLDDVIDYLRRNTEGGERWERLFAGLRAAPDSPLARALDTPLMVSLLRDVYKRPSTRPTELLDRDRFPTEDALRRHLAGALVGVKFPLLGRRPRRGEWDGADARRWLAFLAAGMQDREMTDIAWWRLPELGGGRYRFFAGALAAVITGATAWLTAWGVARMLWGWGWGMAVAFSAAAVFGIPMGIRAAHNLPTPSEMQFTGRKRLSVMVQGGLFAALVGGLCGFLAGGFGRAAAVGAIIAVPVSLAYAGAQPDTTVRAATPRTLFRRDAMVVGIFSAAYGASSALAGGLLVGPVFGAALGVCCALCGGLLYGLPWWFALGSKHSSGLVASAHLWLFALLQALRGKCPWPWRLMAFLEEARNRDVLRQVGPVYQFRHAYLREVLAESAS